MTYFTHRTFRPDGRCCGCNRHLLTLMRISRWRGSTVTPVCADANLAFIEPVCPNVLTSGENALLG